jgi:hypothetical protein
MSDEALIQISRTSGGRDGEEMQVEIIKGETHIRLGMTLCDFAEMITGSAKTPCTVRRWRIEE